MNEPDFSKARVGDKVWDLFRGMSMEIIRNGSGELCLSGYGTLPRDGKHLGVQRFYWSPPTITGGCEPPKRIVKKVVWQNLYFNDRLSGASLHALMYDSEHEALENRVVDLTKRITESETRLAESIQRLDEINGKLKQATDNIARYRSEIAKYREEIAGYRTTIDGIKNLINGSGSAIEGSVTTITGLQERIEYCFRIVEEIESRIKSY